MPKGVGRSYVRFSLSNASKIPVLNDTFPVNRTSEFWKKSLRLSRFLHGGGLLGAEFREIPCKIPCLHRIWLETGAICTASPANHSLN